MWGHKVGSPWQGTAGNKVWVWDIPCKSRRCLESDGSRFQPWLHLSTSGGDLRVSVSPPVNQELCLCHLSLQGPWGPAGAVSKVFCKACLVCKTFLSPQMTKANSSRALLHAILPTA